MKPFRRVAENLDLIPTSSMADIAFLLVIYFMITVTFSVTKGLDFALPETDDEVTVVPEESTLVEVLADGSLRVDGRPMALAGLLGYLAPKLERNPAKPVILHTDPRAHYGAMIAVYDELRQGRQKLGLGEEIRIAVPTEREVAQFWR